MLLGTYLRSQGWCWWSYGRSEGISGNVRRRRRVVKLIDGVGGRRDVLKSYVPYWWPKERIEGMSGGIGGLTRHIKGLSGYVTSR